MQNGGWTPKTERLEMEGPLESVERDLIRELVKYDELVALAADEYSPALIANYAYDLAKLYNKFYHELSILKTADDLKEFRLVLSAATARIISRLMEILGIQVPDRM